MNKLFLITAIVLGVVVAGAIYSAPFSSNYESWTAAQKADWLWKQVLADNGKSSEPASTLQLARMVAPEFLGGYSFTPTGHLLSDQFPFSSKKKAIHSVGHAGLGKFVWNSNASKYTGLFKKADHVFFRFSTATPPSTFEGKPNNGPGISIKGLRDGVLSGSFPVMWSLLGQDTESFFDHCFSNHIDAPTDDKMSTPQKILLKKFKGYDSKPNMVGLSDFAAYTQDGKKEETVVAPMALYWQANPALQSKCKNVKSFTKNPLLYGCLEDLTANTELFKIYAVSRPYTVAELGKINGQGVLQEIGHFVLTSDGMKPSEFADDRVHFKHVYWSDDVKAISGASSWDIQASDEYQLNAGCHKFDKYAPKY